MYIPLFVSAAFHSRYMAEVGREFENFLHSFALLAPQGTVVANVTAEPYPSEPDLIKARLAMQITQPVRWAQSIQLLLDQGVTDFREVGPGNVLTRLVQQIRQERPALI
jgi:malonyl CoA-acyl carrier protein transacylase